MPVYLAWLGPVLLVLLFNVGLAGIVAAQGGLPGLGVPFEGGTWRYLVMGSDQVGSLSAEAQPAPPADAFADVAQRPSVGAEFAILATGGAAARAPDGQLKPQNGVFLVLTMEVTNRSNAPNMLDLMDFGLKPANQPQMRWTRPRSLETGDRLDWRVLFKPGETQRFRAIYDVSPATVESGVLAWGRLREPAGSAPVPAALPRTGELGAFPLTLLALLALGLGVSLRVSLTWWLRRSATQ